MLSHNLLFRDRIEFDIGGGIRHFRVFFVYREIRRWEPEMGSEVGFGGTASEDADGGIVA